MEKRICRATGKEFIITSEDKAFYEKIGVPYPTLCPEERQRRRALWRNERTLYRRICDKTGENIVSMYSPNNRFPVYSIKEWWSDSWSANDYGRDIDFNKSFFEQFKDLQNAVPRLALLNKNCINSDYANHANNSKDTFMSATAFDCENVLYSTNVFPAKDASDCYSILTSTNQNLYEMINAHGVYNCQYGYLVYDSFDCLYSFDLKGCSNCFMSCNLRNQSYYFRNKKYSKEEYLKKIQELHLSSYKEREVLYKEWKKMIDEYALHRATIVDTSINSMGSFIEHSKNVSYVYDVSSVEDSKYIYMSTHGLKDCYDCYHVGVQSELQYESHATTRCSNTKFTHLSYDNTNLNYCDSCHNSNELFGCVGIKKGSYMIFNKQYSKEEYFELKTKLIEHMKNTGEYGEFFPYDLSPFACNESQAQIYMPLEKDEALRMGFKWKEDLPGTYRKGTILEEDIPDMIENVTDDITKEILTCIRSGRNYNIVPQELDLYRKLRIPIPRLHPDQRYLDRIHIRPDRNLYAAKCSICEIQIQTAYNEEKRPKELVCDKCYKEKVL